jgi:hypothetical protein
LVEDGGEDLAKEEQMPMEHKNDSMEEEKQPGLEEIDKPEEILRHE